MPFGRRWGPWLVVLACLPVRAATGAMISARFEITPEGASAASEQGRFCFDDRGAWRMDISSPAEQTFISGDTLTVILYPKEKRAFRIRTGLLEPPSHLFFFANSMATNEQLTAMGLTMTDFASFGDTTITSWKATSAILPGAAGHLEVRRVGPRLARFDLHHADDRVSRYEVTSRDQEAKLPTRITMSRWKDDALVEESVRYWDVQVGAGSPDLLRPEIPEGFRVEDRAW